MKKPTILVTGATGKTGSAVVHELIARAMPVRAIVHRKDARSDDLARKGAEVVVADMFDADQLADALQGVKRAYYHPGYDLDRWDRQKGFPMPPHPSLSIEDDRWREEHHELMKKRPFSTATGIAMERA